MHEQLQSKGEGSTNEGGIDIQIYATQTRLVFNLKQRSFTHSIGDLSTVFYCTNLSVFMFQNRVNLSKNHIDITNAKPTGCNFLPCFPFR